jgi:DNA-binding NarL/FixJ family response regulator
MKFSAPHAVAIVEDDVPTRGRLTEAINGHRALSVVAELGCLAEARDWLGRGEPCDALLVDLGLPDGPGVSIIREARGQASSPEVMVITSMGDRHHVLEAIEAGASGYLLKDADPGAVGDAVLELIAGGSPISPSIARHLLRRFQEPSGDPPAEQPEAASTLKLTPRETEVLGLAAKGLTYEEIAQLLGMSYHTVTTHTRHIYRKLSARSRSEAVFEALRQGLIRITGD